MVQRADLQMFFLSVQKSKIFELCHANSRMQIVDLRKTFGFLKTISGFTFHIGLTVKKAVKNRSKERFSAVLLDRDFTKDNECKTWEDPHHLYPVH